MTWRENSARRYHEAEAENRRAAANAQLRVTTVEVRPGMYCSPLFF
jgi:hypothetical protein